MTFLQSYRRLTKAQRIVLGLCGIIVGWYGPRVVCKILSVEETQKTEKKAESN